MPELPEVETVVNDLRPNLVGKKILEISLEKNCKNTFVGNLLHVNKIIKDQKITEVSRRAKYILIHLEKGGLISIHLRMTGRLILNNISDIDLKYSRAIINLHGNKKLFFKDVRKFGKIEYLSTIDILNKKLGIEPLSKEFTTEVLGNLLAKSKKNIKSFLLDQKYIVGLGNIYVDEALFLSTIHPLRKASEISKEQINVLCKNIKTILDTAIKNQGTTFNSFYYGVNKDNTGNNYGNLKVYDRQNLPCKKCKSSISKIKVAGRGTYICNNCQIIN